MEIRTLLNFVLAYWWIILIVSVASITVWLALLPYRRRRRNARIEHALSSSHETIAQLRGSLSILANKKSAEYYTDFNTQINDMIKGVTRALSIAASHPSKNTQGILRVCNSRTCILTLKKALHDLSENIEKDFLRVYSRLDLEIKIPSKKKSLATIVHYFLPLLSHYSATLAQMPKHETALMATTIEYQKLANPGFFSQVGRFFSSGKKKRDESRLFEIRKQWSDYLCLWQKIDRSNEAALAHLRSLLQAYCMMLFVFTPCEALVKQVVKRKSPLQPDLHLKVEVA